MGTVSRRLLAISPKETSFARRGFRCDSAAVRRRLEEVGRCFVAGYSCALEASDAEALAARIAAEVARDFQGFAYEGAAMALTLLDALTPWRRDRLRRFLAGPGDLHVYISHVGAGWALARLPISVQHLLAGLHPVYGWLSLDGYGFHQGFFHWREAIAGQTVPRKLRGYARRVFDQGLGRSLWFVEGADPGRIGAAIGAFPVSRRPDLWSGLGLAASYAGGVPREALEALRQAAGDDRAALAQGAAFAAKARLRAGIPIPETALGCAVLCGTTMEQAAAVTDEAMPAAAAAPSPAPADGLPLFEHWRRGIQERFTSPSTPLGPAQALPE